MEQKPQPVKTPLEMEGDELYNYLMSRDNEAFLRLMADTEIGLQVPLVCSNFDAIALNDRYEVLVNRLELKREYLPQTRQMRIEFVGGHVLFRDATAEEQIEYDPELKAAAKNVFMPALDTV